MKLIEAIQKRHSVRSYLDKQFDTKIKHELINFITECNIESGLHIQLICDEPNAFTSFLAHYGKFKNVKNYIALVGKTGELLDETCGYYGEKIVLKAQQLGLNTCWVALTYNKKKAKFELNNNEKLICMIAIGYGETQGNPRKSKAFEDVVIKKAEYPDWFISGVNAALLAPTATNQQKFKFEIEDNIVDVKAGKGFYTHLDLGIVKYHFEIAANKTNFTWKKLSR